MEIFLRFLHFQAKWRLRLVPFLRRCRAWLQASESRPGVTARCQAGKQTALVQFPTLVLLSLQNLSFGRCLMTVSLNINEPLKWISPLPVFMHNHSGCDGVTSGTVPPTSPHHHLGSQSPPCQYLSRDNLALNRYNKQMKVSPLPPSLIKMFHGHSAPPCECWRQLPTYPGFESLGEGRGIRTRVYE